MAQHEHLTVNRLEFNKGRGTTGTFILEACNTSDGKASIEITTEQLVEVIGVFTASHKLKIRLNGIEFWMPLDAV